MEFSSERCCCAGCVHRCEEEKERKKTPKKTQTIEALPAVLEFSAALSACASPLLPAGLKSYNTCLDLVFMLQIKLWGCLAMSDQRDSNDTA